MHIAFLLTQDLESPSGLGRYWPISKELVRLGHEITILALHSNYASLEGHEKDFLREDVRVRYVGQMHVRKVDSRKLYFASRHLLGIAFLASLQLTRAALRTEADVYHIGKPHPMNSLAGLVGSRLRGKPLYLDCDDYESVSNRFYASWQRRIVGFFERRMPHLVEGITTNTRFTRNRLADLGIPEDRIVYIPNGVERSRFSHILDEDVNSLRDQLNLAGKEIVLYVGSMSLASHAVDLLLEGFAILRETEPSAELLLVGGGEDYDRLRAQAKALGIADSVQFIGRVSPARAPVYYALADVSVDPVRNDPASQARYPLKVVESLACGTPVVTSDVGDRGHILKAASGSLMAVPGDATSLAEMILQALHEREPSCPRRQSGVHSNPAFYWDQLATGFLQAYAVS